MTWQEKVMREIMIELNVVGCPTYAIVDKIKLLKARIDALEIEKIELKELLEMWSGQR